MIPYEPDVRLKVMWLCNSPIPQVAQTYHISETIHEGWLINVATELQQMQNIEFDFVFPNKEVTYGIHYRSHGESCYIAVNCKEQAENGLICMFEEVLSKIRPDIIHIWGTEYVHSWAMTKAAEKLGLLDKVVVSMQGLVSMIATHYMGGIPAIYQLLPSFRDVLRQDTLRIQKKNMILRGKYERETLSTVKHVIGRTFWDKACVRLINSDVKYHFNNETLRETFYESKWNSESCIKHSLFVSQTHYPIKGFHFLLEAVAILKEKYPDISVYVSGHDNALKTGIRATAYGRYLQHLIKKHELSKHIHYVGMLNAQEMKQRFLQSEVFVSPSIIENSPNSVGEAMLLGMPIVASNVGGTADMLTHDKEGYLYQADAPYLLAYYIGELFENADRACEFGKNAREHAKITHNKDRNIRALIEIYCSLK